jgi:lysophospholipase L1-like esterase
VEPSLQPTVRHRTLRHAHPRRPRRSLTLVALALGILTVGTASIGAAVGGAGAVTPPDVAATTAASVEPSAPRAPLPPPVARSWWPLSVVGASRLSDVRSDRTCIPSSAGTLDRGEAPPLTAPARAEAVPIAPRQAVAAPRTRPVAAFLGDSYTTGYNGAGLGRAGWPAIVSAAIHLRSLNRAVAGTGFINPGWTAQPIRTRVAAVVRAHPRIVFLAGGHNDRRFATAAVTAAADVVIDRLHRALPDTILVVVGPIWRTGDAPRSLRRLRDHLRRKSAAVGALFIDPIRGGWFAGSAARLIGPDGIHPTNAGHRHIAQLVLHGLEADPRFRAKPSRPPATSATSAPVAASTATPVAAPIAGCTS